jgi:hypothetical protein
MDASGRLELNARPRSRIRAQHQNAGPLPRAASVNLWRLLGPCIGGQGSEIQFQLLGFVIQHQFCKRV